MTTALIYPPLRRRGFTLIEMIIVMVIISILAGLGIGLYQKASEMKREKKTQVHLAALGEAIIRYQAETGYYPGEAGDPSDTGAVNDNGVGNSFALYKALYSDLDGDGEVDPDQDPYLPSLNPLVNSQGMIKKSGAQYMIVDAWGREFFYRLGTVSGANSTAKNPDFDLWSSGKNESEEQDDFYYE